MNLLPQMTELISSKFKKIIVVPGNHDTCLGRAGKDNLKDLLPHCHHVLVDESVNVFGINFYGSPWIPPICDGDFAFVGSRGSMLDSCWKKIPEETDILLTHTPPLGVLDLYETGNHEGCFQLLNHTITRVKPKFHIFGHIHGAHGVLHQPNGLPTTFINAAMCFFNNQIKYRPIVFDYPVL